MLLNSKIFVLVFLPVTLIGFFWIARRFSAEAARVWLLVGSWLFYGWWSLAYLGLLIAWMLLNYAFGQVLHGLSRQSKTKRCLVLVLALASNIALLGYFKYAAFLADGIALLVGIEFAVAAIVLPLAISFHTFQQIAYLLDVYNGAAPRYSLQQYLLFVSFFPQLIAGPIVHHHELMPQFRDPNIFRFNAVDVSDGLAFFVIGLLKKLLLADPISALSTPIFVAAAASPPALFEAWRAALAFGLGLYFDFSAYSDMAVGLARMFGIRLPYNFNSPYQATSIIEFWRRWHMTLSRWLRDYLYIPMGGGRRGSARRYANLMMTMMLGGLWHGAAWPFVFWGALHGLFLSINHLWHGLARWAARRGWRLELGRVPAQVLTLLAVTLAWVFFAAPSFSAAIAVLAGMAGGNGSIGTSSDAVGLLLTEGIGAAREWHGMRGIVYGLAQHAALLAGLAIVFCAPNSQQIIDGSEPGTSPVLAQHHWRFRYGFETALAAAGGLLLSLALMTDVKEFVYFQF